MEYLYNLDSNIKIRFSLSCKLNGLYTAEKILSELKQYDEIRPYKTTGRAKWPDYDLRGVTFETEDFEGKILPDKIELHFTGKDTFNIVYKKIKTWFENTVITIPEIEEFYVNQITLSTKSENALLVDESKTIASKGIGQKYIGNDSISIIQSENYISAIFNQKVKYNNGIKEIENLLENEVIMYSND
mgnify:CR=1 FL=1